MSTLFVNNLNTASGSTITVPTGKKLVVTDTGGLGVLVNGWTYGSTNINGTHNHHLIEIQLHQQVLYK